MDDGNRENLIGHVTATVVISQRRYSRLHNNASVVSGRSERKSLPPHERLKGWMTISDQASGGPKGSLWVCIYFLPRLLG